MLGAIVGDIVGSIYEWHNIKTKDFPLFSKGCQVTDDSIMTIAVAEGLMNGGNPDNYIEAMKRLGKMYPHAGYGGHFGRWLFADDTKPYNSWGNGAAMRVSPVGWQFDSLDKTEKAAEISAAVTHNHPEGIKGAQATAAAIFLARSGKSKEEIKSLIANKYGYNLTRTLDEIRPSYQFDESCMGTVPEAIIAFLESEDFEDAIRNAISLGGDSDTLAAITGSIAEAAYGVPETIKSKALSFIDQPWLEILNRWQDNLKKEDFLKNERIS
jgi:ADP-ribosylglycohydrolase